MNSIKHKISKYYKLISCYIFTFFLSFQCQAYLPVMAANSVSTDKSFWRRYQNFYGEYKLYLNIFLAIAIIINIGILVYHLTQLGLNGDNPHKRQEAISNILITSVCLAFFGGIVIFMYILYHLSANALA